MDKFREDKEGELSSYQKINRIWQRTMKEVKEVTGDTKLILIIQEDKNTRAEFSKGFSDKEKARISLSWAEKLIYKR